MTISSDSGSARVVRRRISHIFIMLVGCVCACQLPPNARGHLFFAEVSIVGAEERIAAHLSNGDFEEAAIEFDSLCNHWLRGTGESEYYGRCLHRQAIRNELAGRQDVALAQLQKAVLILEEELGMHADTSRAMIDLSTFHLDRGNFYSAMSIVTMALGRIRTSIFMGSETVRMEEILRRISAHGTAVLVGAKIFAFLGLIDQALDLRASALKTLNGVPFNPGRAALVHEVTSAIHEQRSANEEALHSCEDIVGHDMPDEGALGDKVLDCIFEMSRGEEEQSKEERRRLRKRLERFVQDNSKSALVRGAGDVCKLRFTDVYIEDRELDELQAIIDRVRYDWSFLSKEMAAMLAWIDSDVLLQKNAYGRAEAALKKAEAILEAEKEQWDWKQELVTLPAIRKERARVAAMSPGKADNESSAHIDAAVAELRKGAWDEAERNYERALAARQDGAWSPVDAELLLGIGSIRVAQGRSEAALEIYEELLVRENEWIIYDSFAMNDIELAMYSVELSMLTHAVVSVHLGRFSERLDFAELALTAALRRKGRSQEIFAKKLHAIRTARYAPFLSGGSREREGPHTSKGKETEEQASRLMPLRMEDRFLLWDLQRARALYARLSHRVPESGSELEHQAKLKQVIGDRDRYWQRFIELGDELGVVANASESLATVSQMQKALPASSVLIEFVYYTDLYDASLSTVIPILPNDAQAAGRYGAYLMFNDRIDWVDLGPAGPIHLQIRELRESLALRSGEALVDAQVMYELVMKPVVERLGSASRRIFLSPDGALGIVPFGALHDGQRYMVELYELDYLTSGRDLLRLRKHDIGDDRPVTVLAVANPEDANLRGAEKEARILSGIFPWTQTLRHDEATESRLRTLSRPWILHLATHGFFGLGPAGRLMGKKAGSSSYEPIHPSQMSDIMLQSGLVLAEETEEQLISLYPGDGRMTAYEILDWDLHGTELVTLSACDSGLGEITFSEGIMGLRRAFAVAGAQTQVMSLWKISDSVTPLLMEAFYGYLKEGAGRGEAMRRAQRDLLSSAEYAHPHYWAAFIVSGEWGPIHPPPPGTELPPPLQARPGGCRASVGAPGRTSSLGIFALLIVTIRRRSIRVSQRRRPRTKIYHPSATRRTRSVTEHRAVRVSGASRDVALVADERVVVVAAPQ